MKRYGISETKRCVIVLAISTMNSITRINYTIPDDAAIVTGIYPSIAHVSKSAEGAVSVRFSSGASNSFLMQRITTLPSEKKRSYHPLHEYVKNDFLIEGYYRDRSEMDIEYMVHIYLEYLPIKCEPK